jgi:hypothetical protein
MFKITKNSVIKSLDEEIDRVIIDMSMLKADSDEYKNMTDNLEKLYKARSHTRDSRISPDTLLVVVGNLIGIGIILGYEKAGVITSKALSFVIKGRV